MKILVACEESQAVCNAFRAIGHEAWSCDLQPCSGGHPEWHLQCDCIDVIKNDFWDIIIFHPDCTCMSVSGNAHYGKNTHGYQKRLDAITWTVNVWNMIIEHSICSVLENPVSVIFQYLSGGKLQYIQPHDFGHPESKKTGLYIRGLDLLVPTNKLDIPECGYWENQTPSHQNKLGPSKDRKKIRSRTYVGIAEAMASQWCVCYKV
jgi:hypothetical protein